MAEKEYIERETVRNTIKALCAKYNQSFGGHYGGFGEELAKTIDNMPAAVTLMVRSSSGDKILMMMCLPKNSL